MGFFSRLTNLARGSWAARGSSSGKTLTKAELEKELRNVQPAPSKPSATKDSAPIETNSGESESTPSVERDADGNIIKSL